MCINYLHDGYQLQQPLQTWLVNKMTLQCHNTMTSSSLHVYGKQVVSYTQEKFNILHLYL